MANANIFQSLLQPVRSVADYGADLDKAEGNKLLLAAKRLEAEQTQRGMADEQAARSAYMQSGGDQAKYRNALVQAGNYKAVQALDAAALAQGKTKAETSHLDAQTGQANATAAKTVQETKFAAATQHAQQVTNVRTPDDAVAYIDDGIRSGVFPAEQRDQMLQKMVTYPSVEAWKQAQVQGAIPVLERMKVEAENSRNAATNATSRQNNQETNATSRSNNAATVGEMARGHNMTDARSREANSAGKVPAGYRAKPDGTLEFIPGGPADPAAAKKASPTEFQGKSAAFGGRAQEADRIIADLEKKGVSNTGMIKNTVEGALGLVPFIGDKMAEAGGSVMNTVPSAMGGPSGQQQQVEQAQRDFINAILRQESGAAIGQGEFANARKQYFAQPGDSDVVKAQKASNRKLAVQGLINNAGNATVPKPAGGGSGEWSITPVN